MNMLMNLLETTLSYLNIDFVAGRSLAPVSDVTIGRPDFARQTSDGIRENIRNACTTVDRAAAETRDCIGFRSTDTTDNIIRIIA